MRSPGSRLLFRLRETASWWRHTAWFQFAHKPLCSRFHRDVLSIGRYRVCRSCALMYTGFVVAGALLALSGIVRNPPWLVSAFFGLLVPILAVSHPVVYRRLSRWGRDIARATLGICCALYAAVVASGAPVASIFGGFVLLTVSVAYRRMRIRFKKTACAGCPELGAADPICSGYAEQTVSVRRFQVTIEDLLNRDSMPPPVAVRSGRRSPSH